MLKPDRSVVRSTSWHITDIVGEPGLCMSFRTLPTGNGKEGGSGVVSIFDDPSGKHPAGMLMTPVVADNGRTPPNWNTGEVHLGQPVELMTKGYAYTDKVAGSPAYGAPAYQGADGKFTTADDKGALVGKFGEQWGDFWKIHVDFGE